MLDAVDGLLGLPCDVGQAQPDEHGTGDMVSLDARLAALVFLDAGDLLEFAVKLLDLPAHATHLLYGSVRILSQVVGDDPIRAVGGYRNPEQFDLVVFRETLDLDELAMRPVVVGPRQLVDAAIRLLAAGIVDLAVVLERAVINLVQRIDEQHQLFCRVPGIHEDRMKRQLLVLHDLRDHVLHMIELAFAIPVGIVDAVIDDPVLACLGIDVHAVDQADTFDKPVCITGKLQPHQFDLVREVLVQHRVIENHETMRRGLNLRARMFPHQPRCQPVLAQVAIDRIVAHLVWRMVRVVRDGVVDLAHQQVLAVIQSCRACRRHARQCTDFPPALGLPIFRKQQLFA